MLESTQFRGIDTDLAGRLAVVAKSQGADLVGVIRNLREGHTIKSYQAATLLSGFEHACKMWLGHIALGFQDSSSTQLSKEVARNISLEVQSWLNENKRVGNTDVPMIECTPAIRSRFDTCIAAILNATKTE